MEKLSPALRWAGGKRRLASTIRGKIPQSVDFKNNKFIEPFAGSAAVSLHLADICPGKNLVLGDTNHDLIITYKILQTDSNSLISALKKLAEDVSETGYYRVRAAKPKTDLETAARFIYLNKTCFNGLWRVNKKGQNNVPYGKLKNPNVCDTEKLKKIGLYLAKSTIVEAGYTVSAALAKTGDVVYLDPPYVPLSSTASFSAYAKEGFEELDHWALRGCIEGLTSRGVFVILSNSDTTKTREIFGSILDLESVSVSRFISSKVTERKPVKEVLGTNYHLIDRGP